MPAHDFLQAITIVLQIDPGIIATHWVAVVVLTLAVIVGKIVGVSIGAFLTGSDTRTSVQAGMSMAQIGEFSFIIAGLGLSLGATGDFLYPVAVAVSAITTLTTPWLVRAAGPVASLVDRKLPRPLQTFVALYGAWLEQLRRSSGQARSPVRRLIRLLVLDVALLITLIIGAAVALDRITGFASAQLGLSPVLSRVVVATAVIALALPFLVGVFNITRKLGVALALMALPAAAKGKVDLAAAPRRALVVTLQLTVSLLVGLPIMAVTQPFLPGWVAVLALTGVLLVLGVVFWRSATNLHGHVRAGAQMIVEALVTQSSAPATPSDAALERIKHLMPGLGEPVPVRLAEQSRAVGRTLAELDLRSLTGASVLAIARGQDGVIIPEATEVLRAGDVLALSGTGEAVAAAAEMLAPPTG